MEYQFSANSEKELNTATENLQKVFRLAIKVSQVDFGVSEGYRPVKRQQKLYAQGRTEPGKIVTNVDGINKLSDHNEEPSKAVDIYAWVDGKVTYEEKYMMYLGGVITACANKLGINIKWGANWDGDGILVTDQNLIDAPHYSDITN